MRASLIGLFLFYISLSCFAQTPTDSVTISGRITDYDGQPLDSVSVRWQHANFSFSSTALSNKDGYYTARVKKGKYASMMAIKWDEYPWPESKRAEDDMRLEFWGWNFIADRDTTFDIQYHRMEAYGINVFMIRGGAPVYTIYVRPMSLKRALAARKNPTQNILWAPAPDKAEVKVTINGVEAPIRLIQEVKEYIPQPGKFFNAYLLSVDLPQKLSELPYDIFRVQLTDKETGERGEGVYFKEKETYE